MDILVILRGFFYIFLLEMSFCMMVELKAYEWEFDKFVSAITWRAGELF